VVTPMCSTAYQPMLCTTTYWTLFGFLFLRHEYLFELGSFKYSN
jgi:hypothetical protein